MTRSDLLRRTLAVLGAVLCLLAVAGVAQARFSAPTSAGIQVGTAKMVAPTDVTGTYTCRTGFFTEGVRFAIQSFTDGGPTGASYRFQVPKNTSNTSQGFSTSATRSGTVESSMSGIDTGAPNWPLTVRSDPPRSEGHTPEHQTLIRITNAGL